MEHFTDFYTDNDTGQPIRFMIKKYDIDFLNEKITVYYNREVFNMAQDKKLLTEETHYEVKDEVRVTSFLDPNAVVSTHTLATDFSDWVNYVATGVKMIDLFVGSTLPKIIAREGVS